MLRERRGSRHPQMMHIRIPIIRKGRVVMKVVTLKDIPNFSVEAVSEPLGPLAEDSQ
jgi:hypothetical protein